MQTILMNFDDLDENQFQHLLQLIVQNNIFSRITIFS